MNKKILIIIGHYLPGYKDGGPVRSIKNLTDCLGTEYDFYILTEDRDQGDIEAYPDIQRECWNQVGGAKVWYVHPGGLTEDIICEKALEMDVIYLCGCFNDYARVALKLKKKGKIKGRLIVASMGLFSPGAFSIKYWKKKIYIELLKAMGYFKNVEWSATGKEERDDICRIISDNIVCHYAQDIPQKIDGVTLGEETENKGLRVVFLSRISPKKNLDYALEILKKIKGNVYFDIYGIREDQVYFEECKNKMKELPANIICRYCGEVLPEQVISTFSKYQVFFFPTRGENYGHVIFEAMAGGCIPVISDQTPWNDIASQGIGWTIPLKDKKKYSEVIQQLVNMDVAEIQVKRRYVSEYIEEYSRNIDCQCYRSMFDK